MNNPKEIAQRLWGYYDKSTPLTILSKINQHKEDCENELAFLNSLKLNPNTGVTKYNKLIERIQALKDAIKVHTERLQ